MLFRPLSFIILTLFCFNPTVYGAKMDLPSILIEKGDMRNYLGLHDGYYYFGWSPDYSEIKDDIFDLHKVSAKTLALEKIELDPITFSKSKPYLFRRKMVGGYLYELYSSNPKYTTTIDFKLVKRDLTKMSVVEESNWTVKHNGNTYDINPHLGDKFWADDEGVFIFEKGQDTVRRFDKNLRLIYKQSITRSNDPSKTSLTYDENSKSVIIVTLLEIEKDKPALDKFADLFRSIDPNQKYVLLISSGCQNNDIKTFIPELPDKETEIGSYSFFYRENRITAFLHDTFAEKVGYRFYQWDTQTGKLLAHNKEAQFEPNDFTSNDDIKKLIRLQTEKAPPGRSSSKLPAQFCKRIPGNNGFIISYYTGQQIDRSYMNKLNEQMLLRASLLIRVDNEGKIIWSKHHFFGPRLTYEGHGDSYSIITSNNKLITFNLDFPQNFTSDGYDLTYIKPVLRPEKGMSYFIAIRDLETGELEDVRLLSYPGIIGMEEVFTSGHETKGVIFEIAGKKRSKEYRLLQDL